MVTFSNTPICVGNVFCLITPCAQVRQRNVPKPKVHLAHCLRTGPGNISQRLFVHRNRTQTLCTEKERCLNKFLHGDVIPHHGHSGALLCYMWGLTTSSHMLGVHERPLRRPLSLFQLLMVLILKCHLERWQFSQWHINNYIQGGFIKETLMLGGYTTVWQQ